MVAYLDHAATTPLRPEALEAMSAYLGTRFGNPSGSHSIARSARQAVEEARDRVAEGLGAEPAEVVFTAGGTEADNLAVLGAPGRGGVLCSAIEHDAVMETVGAVDGSTVAVGADGIIDLEALREALNPSLRLVSVMLANNEVGVIQPLERVIGLVRKRAPSALVHSDAVQAFSWLDVARRAAGADLVSISAHKFGGPQGVGALVVRGRARLETVVHGGGQEAGRRSGTHNVAGIVGLAAAMDAAVADRDAMVRRVSELRDRLADGLLRCLPGSVETGDRAQKVAGACHLCIPGVESEALLFLLDRASVCASAGSACASGAIEASHVLVAMGVPPELARGALRLSLGWTTTAADIDAALEAVPAAVEQLRAAPPSGRLSGARG